VNAKQKDILIILMSLPNRDRNELKTIALTIPPDILAEALVEQLGKTKTPMVSRQWHNTDPAWRLLGLNSADQLRRLRRSGLLRCGIEYRVVESEFQFHLSNCESRLSELPEKRKLTNKIPRVTRGRIAKKI
jgi:hypothetical protein